MEINENHLKCIDKIFSESVVNSCERLHPENGYAMPIISHYNAKTYILTSDYMEKYMSFEEYDEFYRKRSMEELINDGVYVEYNGISSLLKDLITKTI